MDDSLFARLGYDPVRIHTHLYGAPPVPGGIVQLSPRGAAPETGAEAGPPGSGPASAEPAPVAPPGEDACPDDAAPPETEPAAAAPAPGPPPPTASDPLPDPHPADSPPDPAGNLQAWLAHNAAALAALAAAGRLPELAPPEPEPAPAYPMARAELPPIHVPRGDRWNKPRMAEFLRQLAATHSVSAAARAVGMHRRSAYKLRARLKGQPFDIAWETAFRHGYDNLAHAALELALEGEEVPHYFQGELKGTHCKRNPQLIVQLLRMRNRAGAPMLGRYGAAAEWWGDRWDALLERVETGAVDWSDERAALGEAGLRQLGVPDEESELKLLELRNTPDDKPNGRSGR